MSDDCVSQVRFTRAFKGLISPPSESPGEIMSYGVSPVNYSDSDLKVLTSNLLPLGWGLFSSISRRFRRVILKLAVSERRTTTAVTLFHFQCLLDKNYLTAQIYRTAQ